MQPDLPEGWISIHALREEGDERYDEKGNAYLEFLSTPSARRATRSGPGHHLREEDFYPRPPRGGRQTRTRAKSSQKIISIHALREEGDGENHG